MIVRDAAGRSYEVTGRQIDADLAKRECVPGEFRKLAAEVQKVSESVSVDVSSLRKPTTCPTPGCTRPFAHGCFCDDPASAQRRDAIRKAYPPDVVQRIVGRKEPSE